MVDQHEPDEDVANALRRLPREMMPPSHVAATLSRALVPRRSAAAMFRLAVAVTLVIAAFAAGRFTSPQSTPVASGQKFALLLYGGPPEGGDGRAAEYGAWAVDARRAGRTVSGERLSDATFIAGAALAGGAPLRGFFIVSAADASDALELARRHPHSQAGTIVVRPIDTP
jgi:hypothetical protein